MLIDKEILVRKEDFTDVYIRKLVKMGYDVQDEFYIDPMDLPNASRIKVNAKCYYCNSVKSVDFKNYKESQGRNPKYSCGSNECKVLKRKETNIEKYGAEFASMTDDNKKKTKQTNIKKYGAETFSKTDEFNDKVKKTSREKFGTDHYSKTKEYLDRRDKTVSEKYGVSHVMHLNEVKEKLQNTLQERYSVSNPMQMKSSKEKFKATNLDRYGEENYTQTDEYKERSIRSNLDKFGVEHYSKTEEFKERVKKTNLEKYGVEHVMQLGETRDKVIQTNLDRYGKFDIQHSDEYRKINYAIAKHPNYIKFLSKKTSLFKCDCGKNHEFNIHSQLYLSRLENNIPLCTTCYPIDDHRSIKEKLVLEYVQSIYSGEVISGYRDKIEIDIYLPELNIGIEFNGIYWHSGKFKDKYDHYNKYKYFKDKGINIIAIWEDDWLHKNEIVKSLISNFINCNQTIINGVDCDIREVSSSDTKLFLDNNHISGYVTSSIRLGLYYNNELVSIATFDKFDNRKVINNGYCLNRYCDKIHLKVNNSLNLLLDYFKSNFKYKTLITYLDIDTDVNSNLLESLGFKYKNLLSPNKVYTSNDVRIIRNKYLDMMKGEDYIYNSGYIKYVSIKE